MILILLPSYNSHFIIIIYRALFLSMTRFDGVPVLYLPGNSGSHMQARSLASVALRKALNSERDYHFDYFTGNTMCYSFKS